MSTTTLRKDALQGIRVLVVDDELLLSSTFCLVLQFAGAVAHSAANGQAALSLMASQTFDVILCDRHMPVMNGPDFIRELMRRKDSTPVLLLTGAFDPEQAMADADLRIHSVLSKPLLPGDLVAAIQSAVRTL